LIDGTVEAQKALSALIRVGENIGITMLINILRGSHNADLLSKGYQHIKTYGIGKNISFEVWQSHILQFLQLGLIEIAYDEGHTLKVTAAGNDVIKGHESVLIAQFNKLQIHDDGVGTTDEVVLTDDKILFEKLRALRKLIADSEGLAPYHVFTDKTLQEMATMKPVTMSAMIAVQGVSLKKYERYGADFIKVILESVPPGFTNKKSNSLVTLDHEQIREYIKQMKESNVRISAFTLTQILLGSHSESVPEGGDQLPFFGILKNKIKSKSLSIELKQFFTTQIETKSVNASDEYFGSEIFNHLSPPAREQLFRVIKGLPINRPTESIDNEYILTQRQTHPRSYEPWLEPEISIFKEAVSQTNDLTFVASAFQRSPDSLKAYYKKMFVANAISELAK
jgi:superfamily II DNA helicase RecQ